MFLAGCSHRHSKLATEQHLTHVEAMHTVKHDQPNMQVRATELYIYTTEYNSTPYMA